MISGIYKITSPSGRIYIGQSINIRYRFYKYNCLSCKGQTRLYNSFLKYGVVNHIFEIIEECNIEELNIRERYYQDLYNVLDNDKGLNCKLTKTTDKSGKMSEEACKKIGLIRKGKKLTEEHKLKISLGNIGKKHSEESKLKISEFKKGKKLSESHRLNIKNKFEGKKVIDTSTNIIYPSIRKASEKLNIYYNTLLRNINGKSKRNKTTLKYLEL